MYFVKMCFNSAVLPSFFKFYKLAQMYGYITLLVHSLNKKLFHSCWKKICAVLTAESH